MPGIETIKRTIAYTGGTQSTEQAEKQQTASEKQQVTIARSQTDTRQTIAEAMQEAREKAQANKQRLKIPSSRRYGDVPIDAYARIARARSQGDVSAAAGFARRQLSQMQSALRQDSDNASKIKSAIAQLKKAILRAGKKKKDLQNEQVLEQRRKRAVQEEQERKAARARLELQRRKAARFVREGAYIQEAAIENRMQAYRDLTAAELRMQAQSIPTQSAAAGIEMYSASAATAAPVASVPEGAAFSAEA